MIAPAPILDMFATVGDAREAVDDFYEGYPTLAERFAANWTERVKVGPAEGHRPEPITAPVLAGAANLLEETRKAGSL